MPALRRFRLPVSPAFDFGLVVRSHGWSDLAPFQLADADEALHLALEHGGQAVDLSLRPGRQHLAVAAQARRPLSVDAAAALRRRIQVMLRLDADLQDFWDLCEADADLRWVARRQAGRILRGATVFEDLLKLLFTTNCSWAATRLMSQRLVDALGRPAPSGRRAFPGAAACAAQDEAFYRDVVRAGYRARHCLALAEGFASGALQEGQFLEVVDDAAELRRRLLALPGFGPYAAGQAMRLLGCYTDLALDSWCRARLAELAGRKRPPADRQVERQFQRFAPYQGLALWMHLTADWHGEPG